MTLANAVDPYGAVGRIIHWTTAALVVVLLGMGKFADIDAEEGGALYGWHSSLGILVLLLVITRIVWRVGRTQPVTMETNARVESWVVKAVHGAFYALLAALPVSGWLLASAEGEPLNVFGIVFLAPLNVSAFGTSKELFEELHEVLGNVMLILVTVHVVAALKHHFVDRDNVLRRMIPTIRR